MQIVSAHSGWLNTLSSALLEGAEAGAVALSALAKLYGSQDTDWARPDRSPPQYLDLQRKVCYVL